ncbi:sensor histidine kinase [Actinocrispum wychmicini]|uniref:histidine kinase n=1 Tax=Actinocrispum wychmicini TaxID=1213861 RepID=A0A4R2JZ11_9PSEU|nr:histidine kinase [Actinocrispum wychmicini]TCO65851.1 signal transduction histidine kinase [Actinocrispum wychmicini]
MLFGQSISRLSERPWWDRWIAVSSLLLGLLYLTDLGSVSPGFPPSPLWLHWVFLFVICVAQTFRRTRPLAALVAGLVVFAADNATGPSTPVMIVFLDLLFCGTLHSSPRAARWIVRAVVGFVFAVVVVAAVVLHNLRATVGIGLGVFSLVIVPVWWAFNIRQHKEIAERERASARQLARINELDRQAAVTAERARMARDLHDVVAGHLSAIAIQSEAVLSIMDSKPELVRSVLKSVRANSVQSLTEMRAMIEVLRDGEDARTAPARLADLDRLVSSARAGGLTVDVEWSGVDGLPVAVDLAAYRIIQEALTNAMKHAAGGSARVCVAVAGAELVVEVTNSLTGPSTGGTGTGLVSMRERAHAVGGSLIAGPGSGGWQVRAVLPTGGLT